MTTFDFPWFLFIWAAFLGTCMGSFLNVVVARLPKGTFLSNVRSVCPDCGHTLCWSDLLPVFSFFLLRGKCRYCGGRISPRYPLVELAGAAFGMLSLWRFGLSLQAVAAFGVTLILLAVSLIDNDTMEIPNSLVVALIPFAVWAVWLWPGLSIVTRIIGFFSVSLPLLLITLVIADAFGGGDIKLMAVCGFLLGWQNTLLAFFIALLTGGGYSIYLLLSGKTKRGTHIAFGPHLCLGTAAALFAGSEIISFYLRFFGI